MKRRTTARVVGARELKIRLGAYLREVRRGGTIVVTDRGEPIAEIRPLEVRATSDEGRLDKLAALGVLSRASKEALRPFRPIRYHGPPLSEAVAEERRDRF